MIDTDWRWRYFTQRYLGYRERDLAEVERLASELIELSTQQNFAHFLAVGTILRGWARSASGSTAQGISVDRRRNGTSAGERLGVWHAIFAGAEG